MPVCTCAAAGTEFTRIGGHVCMRGSEYSGRDRIMKKVLNANAGDNVHPVGDLCALKCMIALALLYRRQRGGWHRTADSRRQWRRRNTIWKGRKDVYRGALNSLDGVCRLGGLQLG